MTARVTLDGTAAWEMPGPGGPLRLFVAWPEQPPPPGGFPLLCVLDAENTFAVAVGTARMQAGRPAATGVAAGVILGVDHPGDRAARTDARHRDYAGADGAAALLRTLDERVLPAVEALVPVDRGRMALFGHSIGALLPLHALLAGSAWGRCCVTASPSLWWGDEVVLDRARAFAADPPAGAATCRLLLTVGGLERPDAALAAGLADRAERMARRDMVGNAHRLAAILRPVMAVDLVEFADENHGSVVPAAVSRAVRFGLGSAR